MNFIDICKKDQKELKAALVSALKTYGYKPVVQDGFIYAEGNVPVLLVAHMDTVHKEKCTIICTSPDGVVMSPQGIGGDDRCGIYMILETIKELKCSVLFTEDEEIGCVGVGKFCKSGITPSVPLNYIIEYDRKNGNDAVFYDCDNPEFTKFITDPEIGFKEAYGSCSDISEVAPHLGIAAVNLSCGYYNQHTQHEYVNVSEMERNIERGKRIIRKPCEKFEYIEAVHNYGKYSFGGYEKYYSSYYDKYDRYDYGSKKSGVSDYSYKDYEDIYANIDEVAFSLYEDGYGTKAPTKSLIPVVELCDYNTKEMVIKMSDGEEIGVEDYCCPDLLYLDISDCGIYVIEEDNTWGIQVAVETDVYLKCKDGSTVMYYEDTLEDFRVMSRTEMDDFNDYVENYLEYDIDAAVEMGILS